MSDVTVSIKLTQKQAGALYMKTMRLEDEVKSLKAELENTRVQNAELVSQLETLKIDLSDAFGDGYYDGFVDGAKHQDNEDLNTKSQSGLAQIQDDALRCSEIAENAKSKRLGIVSRQELVAQVEALKTAYKNICGAVSNMDDCEADSEEMTEAISDLFVLMQEGWSLVNKPPTQCLQDIQADAGRTGFIDGYHYGLTCLELNHPAKTIETVAEEYAERAAKGEA